jgi:hypothetical protein
MLRIAHHGAVGGIVINSGDFIATGESIFTHPHKRLRQGEFSPKTTAIMESLVPNTTKILRKNDIGKAITFVEGSVSNRGYRIGHNHRGQTSTMLESITSN